MEKTAEQYPNPRYAWYMVIVLTVAYILSFDRSLYSGST